MSPANASYLSVWWAVGPSWNTSRAVSHNGGASWEAVSFDNSLAFMPYNGRDGKPVWHPINASIHFSAGGDWVTRSTDGGKTMAWAGDGYNAVMIGSTFQFNYADPNTLFIAFQDYAGASTADGGATWTWQDPSGQGWGGASQQR